MSATNERVRVVGLADFEAAGLCAGLGIAGAWWLVDEKRVASFSELAQILRSDWKGHEELRLRVSRQAPKWGNNDDRADDFARKICSFCSKRTNGIPNGHGGSFQAGFWSIDNDVRFGRETAATPNGRKAGERLSRNNVATDGCGREGVTALMLSSWKLARAL